MGDAKQARVRWFHLTPGRFVIGMLAVEVLLWLSERIGWPGWHKGYVVLTAVASVGVAMLVMGFWCAIVTARRSSICQSAAIAVPAARTARRSQSARP